MRFFLALVSLMMAASFAHAEDKAFDKVSERWCKKACPKKDDGTVNAILDQVQCEIICMAELEEACDDVVERKLKAVKLKKKEKK